MSFPWFPVAGPLEKEGFPERPGCFPSSPVPGGLGKLGFHWISIIFPSASMGYPASSRCQTKGNVIFPLGKTPEISGKMIEKRSPTREQSPVKTRAATVATGDRTADVQVSSSPRQDSGPAAEEDSQRSRERDNLSP